MKNKKEKKVVLKKEEIAEDWCFECKEGGELRICDYKQCLKSYHPACVGKEASFLDGKRHWRCPWHSCSECVNTKRKTYLHCYTCTYAVCRLCIPKAEFVRVRGTNGFCDDCLKLVLLIEEGKGCDSNKDPTNFENIETWEGLFKDYYRVIREKEKFELKEFHDAQDREKGKKQHEAKSSSDEYDEDEDEEEEHISDYDGLELEPGKKRKKMPKDKKSKRRKPAMDSHMKSQKMVFTGWGSKPLIEFLTSIGKSTIEKLSPKEVASVVIGYIEENKLFHPEKRKKVVVCDERLQSLLKKKTMKLYMLDDLLEDHFLENLDESEVDEQQEDLGKPVSENVDVTKTKKKLGTENKVREEKIEKKIEQRPSDIAAIIVENVKLIYLQRSLLEELLKEPESFEKKVVGCFVRVKSDRNDCFSKNYTHLRQIKGIKTIPVGENQTEIALLFSTTSTETRISSLRDGSVSEEECVELKEKVQAGLFQWPKVDEFQKKAELLHKDITKHWIAKELIKVRRDIDQANEKGWRYDIQDFFRNQHVLLFLIVALTSMESTKLQYIHKRKMLQTPSEVTRLLETLPKVIPDTSELGSNSEDIKNEAQTDDEAPESIRRCKSASPGDRSQDKKTSAEKTHLGNASTPEERQTNTETCGSRKPQHGNTPNSDFKHKNTLTGDHLQVTAEEKKQGSEASHAGKESGMCSQEMHLNQEPKTSQMVDLIELPRDIENPKDGKVCFVPKTNDKESDVWCFLLPNDEIGKCSSSMLRFLGNSSPGSKFKVWRDGQNEESAILLQEAIKFAFPE